MIIFGFNYACKSIKIIIQIHDLKKNIRFFSYRAKYQEMANQDFVENFLTQFILIVKNRQDLNT